MLLCFQFAGAQVLLNEDFNYPAGDSINSHGWACHSGSSGATFVVTPGLEFPGYAGSGIGNAAGLVGNGMDNNRQFSQAVTTGAVYAAFMVKPAATNYQGYFLHLGKAEMGTAFFTRAWINATGNGLALGPNADNLSPWVDVPADATSLVVIKYSFADNQSSLYAFQSFPTEEPAAPHTSYVEQPQSDVGTIALRKFNNSQNVIVDGIRVATTWAEAVAAATGGDVQAPVATFEPADQATGVALDVAPTITFNEPIYTVEGDDITPDALRGLISFTDGAQNAVGYDVVVNVSSTVVTITPSMTLADATTYHLAMGPVADEAGNASLGHQASFTTVNTLPTISIFAPTNGALFTMPEVIVGFEVQNFTIGADGYVLYTVDAAAPAEHHSAEPITLSDLAEGAHTVALELVGTDGQPLATPATASVSFTVFGGDLGELFFSEYIEGSNNNKALEIYNPNPVDMSLDGYRIELFTNGSSSPNENNTLNMSGVIPANGVYVVANSGAWDEILAVANTTSTCTYFNGDDAVALYNGSTLVDVVGLIGEDPGDGWTVAGVANATKDHTMVRKNTVTQGNTNWAAQCGTNADDSEWVVMEKDDFSNLGTHTVGLSAANDIVAFALAEQTSPAVIDAAAHTVEVVVLNGTELGALVATFTLSPGATATVGGVAQVSGTTANDFTAPVAYTVAAQNGDTQAWTVTVTEDTNLSAEAEILAFAVAGQVGQAVINSQAATVNVTVATGTAVTALAPEIAVSPGATVSPASGAAQDFTAPVVYTVTAQDGTTKAWTVTVAAEQLTTIHEIQYTAEGSGDSPYKDQEVTTSGIVTGVYGTQAFYIQDGEGEWNGLYVYKGNQSLDMPAVGDHVQVCGLIAEYYNLTELKNLQYINVLSSGNELPAATEITAAAAAEPFEGVLVHASDFVCVHDGNGDHWISKYVNADAPNDTLKVFRQMYSDFLPTVGKTYQITGVLTYDFSQFKIDPRGPEDIEESNENIVPQITDVVVYPEEGVQVGVDSYVQFSLADDGGVENLTKSFFYGYDEEAIDIEIETISPVGFAGTRFVVVVPAQDEARPIYFRIVANDGELETVHNGSYDILVGVDALPVLAAMPYPNPARSTLTVESAREAAYTIYGMGGAVAAQGTVAAGANSVDIAALPSGLYLISLTDAHGNSQRVKFVKE